MGLETASFVSGLTSAWPLANDKKNQGDDHLRLLKATLQATFPNASKAFYFPRVTSQASTLSLPAITAAAANSCFMVDTNNGSDSTVTLPTLAAGDDGWWCEIMKTSADAFGIIVSPASGTITSKSGATNTIRVGIRAEPARFRWSGTAWYCSKPGPMIGSTENFNGATLPPGYLYEDSSSYSNTAFAELFAVLGSSVLKDKRGRVDIGDGTGSGLTARVLGTSYGAEGKVLVTANLPPYTPAGTVTSLSSLSDWVRGSLAGFSAASGASVFQAGNGLSSLASQQITSTGTLTGTAQGGTSSPVDVVQPSVAAKKIIRAC